MPQARSAAASRAGLHVVPQLAHETHYVGLDQLRLTDAYGEVGLSAGDDRLGGVSVLDDEVRGVARERHIVDSSVRSFSGLDRIGDFNELILDRVLTVRTGLARLVDHLAEVAPVAVAEHL